MIMQVEILLLLCLLWAWNFVLLMTDVEVIIKTKFI